MPLDSLDTLDSMANRTAPTPMQPTQIARPFHHEGWVYEEKVDGWRMLAYKIAGTVKLVSRNGRDHTGRFPAIVAALRKLDATALILDGEVAVYDAQLVSRFEWLQHASPPDLSTPPLFMVFDCLPPSLETYARFCITDTGTIKWLRVRRGLTQVELAKRDGIARFRLKALHEPMGEAWYEEVEHGPSTERAGR